MKTYPLKSVQAFLFWLVFVVSACGPSQAQIQSTQQVAQTQTQAAKPTVTPSAIPTRTAIPTSTPLYMNTDAFIVYMERGFGVSNAQLHEKFKILSASYDGGKQDSPTTLKIKAQYESDVYGSGCLMPIAIISWGVLYNDSAFVFPASLESLEVECYGPKSDLLMAYQVSMADAITLVGANELSEFGPAEIRIIQNNMPPTPTLSPRPTPTLAPTRTRTPRSTIQPTTGGGGPSAKCKDGTYSYSRHRSGTCSGHGGVAEWLKSISP